MRDYIRAMCGRVIQSSGPLRYAIVDGMNVRDSRVHNYPPRWNGAPSQDLLVIRRNHKTGEVSLDPLRWGLIPYWCSDPKGGRKPINAKCESVRDLPTFRDDYRKRRCIVPVDGFFEWKAIKVVDDAPDPRADHRPAADRVGPHQLADPQGERDVGAERPVGVPRRVEHGRRVSGPNRYKMPEPRQRAPVASRVLPHPPVLSVERTGARGRTARPHCHRRPPSVPGDIESVTPFADDLRSIPTVARPRASGAARCPLG
jgi:hypothetical protein